VLLRDVNHNDDASGDPASNVRDGRVDLWLGGSVEIGHPPHR